MKGNRTILIVTTISSFLTPFMGAAINIALPEIGNDLHMNTIQLGWITTSYLLAASVFLIPFGKLSDRKGRKGFFLSGIALFGLASLLSGIAENGSFLIATRLLNGIGGSMIYATAIAILTAAYPKNERGKVLGINVASVYLGLSLGPTIGGYLTMQFGWQSIFFASSLLSILLLPFSFIALKHKNNSGQENYPAFDLSGSLVYGLSLSSIVCGFPILNEISGSFLVVAGIAGLILFSYIEAKAADPLLNIRIFGNNTSFIYSNLAAFINYSATFALVFMLSLYLQQIKGLSPEEAGILLMAQPIMMTILSPLAGKLSDRIEPRIVATTGMGITVAGLGVFAFLSEETSSVLIVLLLMFLGLGFALFSSPNTNAVMSSVQPHQYGIASATLGTMRLTGQTVSMGIALLVLALTAGKSSLGNTDPGQLLSGIRITFTVFSLLCIAGAFFSVKRGSIRSNID